MPELPEDTSRWPDDPYELLGVAHDVDPKTARRAYLKLIKKYKPERAPEAFQLIREAYEFVSRQAEAREQFGEFDSESMEWFANAPAARFANAESRHNQAPEQDLESLWSEAIEGDQQSSYERLQAIAQQSEEGDDHPFLMLYWLAKAANDERDPIDWLVEGMKQNSVSGPLFELYRREIRRDLSEGVSQRCRDLLTTPGILQAVDELIRLRWEAALKLNRPDVFDADLNLLRGRFEVDHEVFWGHIMFVACDYLSWFGDPISSELTAKLVSSINQMGHLAQSLQEDFDRFDLLLELVREQSHAATQNVDRMLHQVWLKIIPATWTESADELRTKLQPLLADMASDPHAALNKWTQFQIAFPASAAQLGGLIEALRQPQFGADVKERHWERVTEVAGRLLNELGHTLLYDRLRPKIFSLAIAEMVDPDWICQAVMEVDPSAPYEVWVDHVREDGALRWAYQAYRAFWG